MIKNKIIFIVVFISLLVIFLYVFLQNHEKDIFKISDKDVIEILQKNQDAKDYMQNHSDFKIDKRGILSKDDIIQGQNGQNFKEVYQELDLEDNRYIKVDLINPAGDRGMITVIDFKNKSVLKAYGIMLFKANGQTKSQTENK